MFCPHCDSANLRKLSLVYESGLTFVDTKSRGVGVGVGRGGLGVGIGGGRTKGTHTTALGTKAAPPLKKKWGGYIIGTIVLLFLTAASAWFWVGVILCAFGAVAAIRYNRNVWPGLYSRWDTAYMCERCGEIDVPRRGEPTVIITRGASELDNASGPALHTGDAPLNE